MVSANDVADFFLTLTKSDDGEGISNMKIQKLLYYAQGFHLAIYGKELFADPIEAWTHGPVVPSIYHNYKTFGGGAIPGPSELDISRFSPEAIELLRDVYHAYAQFSAWKLRDMTHDEPPWKNTPSGEAVPHSLLTDYFKTQVEY